MPTRLSYIYKSVCSSVHRVWFMLLMYPLPTSLSCLLCPVFQYDVMVFLFWDIPIYLTSFHHWTALFIYSRRVLLKVGVISEATQHMVNKLKQTSFSSTLSELTYRTSSLQDLQSINTFPFFFSLRYQSFLQLN